ncbi:MULTISPECIES: 3'-5' exonuclease [unclassified Paenibacillus]|uniref:3'-5' exonuclease n=1 Tax=unclassified Paenibacillus TaxID=185978 RepID=UPI001141C3B7|nr:3'-5' exonuclease [Paenibacillus sp. tmac-D7]
MSFNFIDDIVDRRWLVREDELDDEQYKIRMLKLGNYLIEGCAGSGKTVLALQKAKEIMDSGAGSYLIVLYTVTLRSFIKDGITSLGLDPDRVCNYNQLEKLGYDNADYIIVDEVQDFTEDQLTKLVGMSNNNFIFFGDDAQQLYEHKGALKLDKVMRISNIGPNNHKKLEKNYRLPKSIASFAQYIKSDNNDIVSRCVKERGPLPLIIKCNSLYKEIAYISNIIRQEGWSDVGVLLQNNEKVKLVSQYFEQLGMSVEAKYKDTNLKKPINKLDFYTSKPKIMTYHSSKGLQFEHVFLPSCELDGHVYNLKDALYVAVTRASEDLFISFSENLSPFLRAIPSTYYDYKEV